MLASVAQSNLCIGILRSLMALSAVITKSQTAHVFETVISARRKPGHRPLSGTCRTRHNASTDSHSHTHTNSLWAANYTCHWPRLSFVATIRLHLRVHFQ